ncbi:MAG TPA: hypothetical protein VJM53_06605 [Burkholderiales bacterium]|jgi:predicted Holliday junction resolvase-like endonuclease|nr:hypothetical protein [Burkholderiales bacterium]
MKRVLFLVLVLMSASSVGQVPERDEAYWNAQQQVEYTRRNAVSAQDKEKEAEAELRNAIKAREAAEKKLEQARKREEKAQTDLPAAQQRSQAAVQAWQDAKVEFERIRK